ncbi:MAG: L,D-transpeptidase family protein [Hyphomicrobiaceae bacterium]
MAGPGMRSRSGWTLLAANAAVAVVAGAAMLAVVWVFSSEPEEGDGSSYSRVAMSPDDRNAPHVSITRIPPLRPSVGDDPQETPEPEESEAAPWSTETRADVPREPAPAERSLPFRWPWSKPAAPRKHHTVQSRLAELAPGALPRLMAKFEAAKAPWPPAEIALVAIKDEKALELYARPAKGSWTHIHRYKVLAASGKGGPKLRQGDRQVPEGLYRIALLNPNSSYHVSLRVNYPNAFDRKMAAKDGRSDLGGDIMIHGKNLSAGCLAMGDEAVEEIFVLAAKTGLAKVNVIIAPTDLRRKKAPELPPGHPEWLPGLYTEIAAAMSGFEAPHTVAETGGTSFASNLLSLFSK